MVTGEDINLLLKAAVNNAILLKTAEYITLLSTEDSCKCYLPKTFKIAIY